jgi:hypothetical protein
MKTRALIICAIALLICVSLLLRSKQHHQVVLPTQKATPTNRPSQTAAVKAVGQHHATNIQKMLALPPNATPLAKAIAETNPIAARELAMWQAPIAFYGKVLDENSNAIAGAQVSFHWMETPTTDGSRSSDTESDSEGLFSLHGAFGPTLTVSVSKNGYYTSKSTPDGFRYALGNEPFHPDPRDPVVFYLRKKGQGTELITSANGMRPDVWVRVPKDNTSVRVDFFQKQASATGQLEIRQIKPPWQSATNWSFSLSILNGGLIENHDEFQFEAPEIGYQPTVTYDFAKGESDWTTHVVKQFYIEFGQPRKYGWLRFESDISQETVFVTYALNPTGSRNLEPK